MVLPTRMARRGCLHDSVGVVPPSRLTAERNAHRPCGLPDEAWLIVVTEREGHRYVPARSALRPVLQQTHLGRWPERSSAGLAVWLDAAERQARRVAARAVIEEHTRLVDGTPMVMAIVAHGAHWSAAGRRDDLLLVLTARDVKLDDVDSCRSPTRSLRYRTRSSPIATVPQAGPQANRNREPNRTSDQSGWHCQTRVAGSRGRQVQDESFNEHTAGAAEMFSSPCPHVITCPSEMGGGVIDDGHAFYVDVRRRLRRPGHPVRQRLPGRLRPR